jgi:hypothetical protein
LQDPAESDLSQLAPGRREPKAGVPESTIGMANPYSWLVVTALIAIVSLVVADWYALRSRPG